jgi:hypothetical protein
MAALFVSCVRSYGMGSTSNPRQPSDGVDTESRGHPQDVVNSDIIGATLQPSCVDNRIETTVQGNDQMLNEDCKADEKCLSTIEQQLPSLSSSDEEGTSELQKDQHSRKEHEISPSSFSASVMSDLQSNPASAKTDETRKQLHKAAVIDSMPSQK